MARPRKFKLSEAQKLVDDYFSNLQPEQAPSITGLAMHMSLHKDTLHEWLREKSGRGIYRSLILEAKQKMEEWWIQKLASGKNTTASIFWLKARAGWQEAAQKIEHEGDIKLSISVKDIDI